MFQKRMDFTVNDINLLNPLELQRLREIQSDIGLV
jgi:hypothetical protein